MTKACDRGTSILGGRHGRGVFLLSLNGVRAPPPAQGCQDETPRLYGVIGKRRCDLAARGPCAATGEDAAHWYPRRRAPVAGLPPGFARPPLLRRAGAISPIRIMPPR